MNNFKELVTECTRIFTKYQNKNYEDCDIIEFIEWLEDHEEMKEINWNRHKESPFEIEDFFIDYKVFVIIPRRNEEEEQEQENDNYDEFEAYLQHKEYYRNVSL
jgi:hypothetical protein